MGKVDPDRRKCKCGKTIKPGYFQKQIKQKVKHPSCKACNSERDEVFAFTAD